MTRGAELVTKADVISYIVLTLCIIAIVSVILYGTYCLGYTNGQYNPSPLACVAQGCYYQ